MMTTRTDFDAKTEANEVVDTFANSVTGKTILITGVGPKGLGAEMASALAAHSPKLLILTGRSLSKVEAVVKDIAAKHPEMNTRIIELDLASFASITAAVAQVLIHAGNAIDILINNAGIMNIPERTLFEGFEAHLMVNYLGPVLFTNSIMPKLLESGAARVVNVVSNGYALSPFRFSDYNFDGKELSADEQPVKEVCDAYGLPWSMEFLPAIAYGQSKTAGILYTVELATRLKEKGVSAVCVHPGAIATDLWRQMAPEVVEQVHKMLPMKSMSQGVATPLVAALDPKLAGSPGFYLNDCQVEDVQPWAKDLEKAKRLWMLTEELLGETWSW